MKKKTLKKILGCILAGTMVMGALTGCGNTQTENQPEESVKESSSEASGSSEVGTESSAAEGETVKVSYPIENAEDVTLKIYCATASSATITSNYTDWTETPHWKAWEEQTGVNLELVNASDYALLMASGDLPDIVMVYQDMYPGGAVAAINEGIYLPLNDYVEYMPDYMALYNEYEEIRGMTTTSDGQIFCLPTYSFDEFCSCSFGLVARADWLEDLGLDKPTTPDEFYNMLKLFKEEKGAGVPFSTTLGYLKNCVDEGILTAGFGIPRADFYMEDGEMHYGYAEQEYKALLEWLHKLYEEGLLDPNFATLDGNTMTANIEGGMSGVTGAAPGGNLGTWIRDMAEADPEYNLCGLPSLAPTSGERSKGGRYTYPVVNSGSFVTTQCENPEIAVQFLNYAYTEAGHMLMNFGVEGESYTMVDGEPVYTDFVMNNPDGWSMAQALAGYTQAWFAVGGLGQDGRYMEQYQTLPQQKEAIATWVDNDGKQYDLPTLSVSAEYADEYSKLANEIKTYVDEMFVKYINGTESLDNFESEYLATLESLGVDRYIELSQIAYEDFMSK